MTRIAESEVVREQASDRGRRDVWSLHRYKICPPRTADRDLPPKRRLQPASTWGRTYSPGFVRIHTHTRKSMALESGHTQTCTKRATQQRKPTCGVERGSIGFHSPPWGECSCPCTNAVDRLSRVILLFASYDLSEPCETEEC